MLLHVQKPWLDYISMSVLVSAFFFFFYYFIFEINIIYFYLMWEQDLH